MPKSQMTGLTPKLSDRQRLQAAIQGDPEKITTQQCLQAAYYVKEECKNLDGGSIAVALIRTGELQDYKDNNPGAAEAADLAILAEHLEGPQGTVTHDALISAAAIFMDQEG